MIEPMRILWAVNIPLPAACDALGLPQSPFGGWLSTMSQRLAATPDVHLGIAMRTSAGRLRSADTDGVRYYALPQVGRGGWDARPGDCRDILADFKPDIVHAHGSEMAYTRRMLAAWSGPRLLSLQGVLHGYAPFQMGGLRVGRMLASLRPRQMLTAAALVADKRLRFNPRLAGERQAIRMVQHVLGRTQWDRAQAWAINPRAAYHHCSRILRAPFYSLRWSPSAHDRRSIFVGNAAAPRKGLHILLDAIALLRREYPGVHVVVAGARPRDQRSRFKRMVGYPAFLQDRIHRLGLESCVEFTGVLDAHAMAQRMASCRMYVLPSLIENSPNTLGEAMLLGMPCVSAYAGGAPDMAKPDIEALFYRAEDPVGLAHQIKRLFDSDDLCVQLGTAAHTRALKTHDPDANLQDLLKAYRAILSEATT